MSKDMRVNLLSTILASILHHQKYKIENPMKIDELTLKINDQII
jgi:hypothetical protein